MTKRLVVAIDCDDVLISCTERLVAMYNDRYGAHVEVAIAHAGSDEAWGAERDVVHRRLDEIQLSAEYSAIEPYPEAVAAVKRLAHQHELHMVTARPESIMAVTERMVEKYFPGCFTSIRHVGPDGTKGEMCAALSANVLVDDSLKHLVNAKECGVPSRLWFGNYPWQSEEVPEPGVVTAYCRDWAEVEAEIDRIAAR